MKYILTILITFLCLSGISQTTDGKIPYTVITDYNKISWKTLKDTSFIRVETNNLASIDVLVELVDFSDDIIRLDINEWGQYIYHFQYDEETLSDIVSSFKTTNIKFKIAEYRKEYSKFVKEDGKIEIIKN